MTPTQQRARRYRVLILIHDDYAAGGLQRSAMAIRQALVGYGHDVEILCLRRLSGGLADRFNYVRSVIPTSASRLFWWVRFLWALRRTIRSENPDVLIGLGVAPSVLLPLISLGISNVRVIGSERIYPPAAPPSWAWRLLRRLAYPHLDKIVCQTRRTRDWFAGNFGIQSSRLAIIPNIIDPPPTATLSPTHDLDSFCGAPLIAAIGRLDPQKGLDFALEIFAEVAARHPHARFLIAGDGPLEKSLPILAERKGLADKLLFRPKYDDLAVVWPRIDVFLLPSRFEGFPNVLAEAMAHGVACVAFDCLTGPAEIITDGVDGYLVPVGDCHLAAVRCSDLITQPELRTEIGRKASRVSELFSAAEIGGKWNNLIEELVAPDRCASLFPGR